MAIIVGALAHVDAGKTTLSESILYQTGAIRNKGRVDHSDTFLDYNGLEKEKGITIFNKEARFSYQNKDYIYLDTPGHSDLAYESSRAIKVIDAAILIVSAIEELPGDTIHQFQNLLNYHIPILIFVNKLDLSVKTKEELLLSLKRQLSENIIPYEDTFEQLSLESDELLEEYLEKGSIPAEVVKEKLADNVFFPCFFGSALKDQTTKELLDYMNSYLEENYDENAPFKAYIYKVDGECSYLKVLSGKLENKASFQDHQVNELYHVSGKTKEAVPFVCAGDIAAVKGLKDLSIGTYLPDLDSDIDFKMPSLTYRILSSCDENELFRTIETLNKEQSSLNITLDGRSVTIDLSGELHMLVVRRMIKERFGLDASFSSPVIQYKESIEGAGFGVGHFEPLRHYAEVLIKMEPSSRDYEVTTSINNSYIGSILTYLNTYRPRGILTNSPLCNIKITVLEIKTHPKHTEGQDLIDACRRAIRHCLCTVPSVLLEPYYLTAIKAQGEELNALLAILTKEMLTYSVEEDGLMVMIPLERFNDIITSLKSKRKGNLDFSIEKTVYEKCHNSEEIIALRDYDYRNDRRNPAGSIFCKSGAGYYVEPEEVIDHMHIDLSAYEEKTYQVQHYNRHKIDDDELKRVWNSLYKPKPRSVSRNRTGEEDRGVYPINTETRPLIYLVDGYNLMYEMDEELAKSDLMNAREKVTALVADFAGYVNCEVVLVFDAYRTYSLKPTITQHDNISVVYTRTGQIADTYIEIKSKELEKDYKVIVVSSDNLEQLRVLSNHSYRLSSREFLIRYENFRRHAQKLNKPISNRPLEKLKELLEEE